MYHYIKNKTTIYTKPIRTSLYRSKADDFASFSLISEHVDINERIGSGFSEIFSIFNHEWMSRLLSLSLSPYSLESAALTASFNLTSAVHRGKGSESPQSRAQSRRDVDDDERLNAWELQGLAVLLTRCTARGECIKERFSYVSATGYGYILRACPLTKRPSNISKQASARPRQTSARAYWFSPFLCPSSYTFAFDILRLFAFQPTSYESFRSFIGNIFSVLEIIFSQLYTRQEKYKMYSWEKYVFFEKL